MTKLKKFITLGTMMLVVGATSVTAFAASSYSTPAEALAGLTGKTVESVIAEKSETGKTYGAIANDAGKLEDYKDQVIEIKKKILAEKVAVGLMTQEAADEILASIENNLAYCDGTGSAGQRMGSGFGGMYGYGRGCGGYNQIQ